MGVTEEGDLSIDVDVILMGNCTIPFVIRI